MENKLIGLKIAKLAKEKGFVLFEEYWYKEDKGNRLFSIEYPGDECLGDYLSITKDDKHTITSYEDGYYFATSQSLLQKWLRENKELIVCVGACDLLTADVKEGKVRHYYFFIHEVGNRIHSSSLGYEWKDFDSYEKALEYGLKEALEML